MKFKNVLSAVWTFLMGAFIAPILISQFGCAPLRTPPKTVSAAPQVSPARPAKPPEEKLPGLIVTEIEGKSDPERLYSFSLRDADIREVLMALSKQTSFNIVVDLDVQGRVTVDLKNVSMVEALDTLT